MTDIYSRKFTIHFSDTDYKRRVKLSSLFAYMQEATLGDFLQNGYSLPDLFRFGYTLVLSRQKIILNHIPLEGETITVETWNKSVENKILCRDFSITDFSGNAIAQATSSWLLVSLKTGKAVDFEECPVALQLNPKEAFNKKLDLFQDTASEKIICTRQARYSDLDINKHVNHCRYVEWCMDALDLDEIQTREIRSFQLNYLAQISFGQKVNLVRLDNSKHHALIYGVSAENPEIVHFQARIGFCH